MLPKGPQLHELELWFHFPESGTEVELPGARPVQAETANRVLTIVANSVYKETLHPSFSFVVVSQILVEQRDLVKIVFS